MKTGTCWLHLGSREQTSGTIAEVSKDGDLAASDQETSSPPESILVERSKPKRKLTQTQLYSTLSEGNRSWYHAEKVHHLECVEASEAFHRQRARRTSGETLTLFDLIMETYQPSLVVARLALQESFLKDYSRFLLGRRRGCF